MVNWATQGLRLCPSKQNFHMNAGTTESFYFCNEVPVGSGGSDEMPRVPLFPSQAAGPQGSIFSDKSALGRCWTDYLLVGESEMCFLAKRYTASQPVSQPGRQLLPPRDNEPQRPTYLTVFPGAISSWEGALPSTGTFQSHVNVYTVYKAFFKKLRLPLNVSVF